MCVRSTEYYQYATLHLLLAIHDISLITHHFVSRPNNRAYTISTDRNPNSSQHCQQLLTKHTATLKLLLHIYITKCAKYVEFTFHNLVHYQMCQLHSVYSSWSWQTMDTHLYILCWKSFTVSCGLSPQRWLRVDSTCIVLSILSSCKTCFATCFLLSCFLNPTKSTYIHTMHTYTHRAVHICFMIHSVAVIK